MDDATSIRYSTASQYTGQTHWYLWVYRLIQSLTFAGFRVELDALRGGGEHFLTLPACAVFLVQSVGHFNLIQIHFMWI